MVASARATDANRSTLLLVIPGASGRLPVLKQLLDSFNVVALVPGDNLARCAWARDLVGDADWVECGDADDHESGWSAVQAWLEAQPNSQSRCLDGVLCYDEFGVELASLLAGRLGLPATPLEQLRSIRDKFSFRERCRAGGLPAARCKLLGSSQEVDAFLKGEAAEWRFPCVLKPVKGAGSWYVSKVDSPEDLRVIFQKVELQLRSGALPADARDLGFLLEEYFAGHEVDIDGWARHGKVEFQMVSDNRPAMEPYFLEMGGVYPSQLPREAVEKLEQLTHGIMEVFPGYHGAFHFEARVNIDTLEIMPIELNARFGGAECPVGVQAVSGFNLPDAAARLALDLPIIPKAPRYACVASRNVHRDEAGVITELSKDGVDIEGCEMLICELFGKVGKVHKPNVGSISCLGWLVAGGSSVEEAEDNLRRAEDNLRIAISFGQERTCASLLPQSGREVSAVACPSQALRLMGA